MADMSAIYTLKVIHQDFSRFEKVIFRKQKQLSRLNKRYEELNTQISSLQSEYDFRIGSLFRKSSILDNEIEVAKSINALLAKGMSYEDAIIQIQHETRTEKERQEKMWEFLEFDEMDLAEDSNSKKIREVWRKLARKFHPDLAEDKDEKKRRENMMKFINNAYAKKDFDLLKSLEEKGLLEDTKDIQTKNPEQLLVELENALIRLRKAYELLKKSEWYSWIKKTQEEKEKLFLDLEANLIREIVKKDLMLSSLKKKR